MNAYGGGHDAQHTSILAKTDYGKKKPDLRRHYPEEWGRFLYNHYDPDVHKKPFNIAMKAPDFKYRYSQGVGLSYKFNNCKVLEKIDVEKKEVDKFKFIRFEEFNQIKDGQVMISIEHCINCQSHNTSTKHDENKYRAFANHMQASVREQFPQVLVIVKPITTDQDEKIKHLRVDYQKDSDKPTLIDQQLKPTRIGALEVQLLTRNEGRLTEKILHSKLKSGMWPSVALILEKIHFFLPRVPKVTIQLFRDNHAHLPYSDNDDNDAGDFKDFQVKIQSSYNSTASQHQLSQYLQQSEQEKLTIQMMARHKRLLGTNKTARPSSAKTYIGVSESLNQVSLFKTQNQFYQKNFQSYTTLPNVRPISASTYQISQRSFDNIHQPGLSIQQSPYNNAKTIQHFQQQQTLSHSKRPISAFTNLSKLSKSSRPMSAQTRKKSNQHSVKKTGRGLGYFGDDNDKVKETEQRFQNEQNYKVKEIDRKADDAGKIVLQHIPVGYYSIDVKGNDFYMSSSKVVNVVNEEDKDEITIFVGVKPRIDTDTEFTFFNENQGNKTHEKLKPEIVEAKAILLPKIISSNDHPEIDDMEEEEYEFDILWDSQKQLWVTTIKTGHYLINVKARGYKEFNKYVHIQERELSFVLTPINYKIPHLLVQAINVNTGKPLKNVVFEFWKESNQQPEEGLSDENGAYSFGVRQIGIQHVVAKKSGFVSIHKTINFTNGFLLRNEDKIITIPMIKEQPIDSAKAFAILTYNGKLTNVKLKALTTNDHSLDTHTISQNLQFVEIDVSQMTSYNVNEESPDKKQGDHNPSVRFVAKIEDQPELLAFDPAMLDRNYKNALQDYNLQFTIVYRDHQGGNQYRVRTLESPSFIDGDVWDICFFCSPSIIETNIITHHVPRANNFFAYYQKLSVFFRNRRTQKFNQTLGFDAHGVYRMDDTWIDERKLVDYLSNLLADKLLSHDQKKMIQKVNLRKEPEEKLAAIQNELNEFYFHFARLFKNLFGYISYKNLQEYIERL